MRIIGSIACSSSCGTCVGSANFCLTCTSPLLAFSGQCVSSCPSGTFNSSGACLQCHPDCASCTGPSFNQCSTCSPKRPVLKSGRCLSTCSKSQFFDLTSSTCQDCDSSCSSCSDSGPNHCLACSSSNQVLRAGSCVSANCIGSSDVIPDLGVCLSELVHVSPNSTNAPRVTKTSTSTSTASSSSSSSFVVGRITWWEILLMVLGGTFIIIVIVVLWRRYARERRVDETVMFASAKHLDGGDGWRWRLRQLTNRWFRKKTEDDPSIASHDNFDPRTSIRSQATGISEMPMHAQE